MNPDAEQPVPAVPDQDGPTAASAAAVGPAVAGAKTVSNKRRTGVPAWRTGKPDAFLASAVDTARAAVEGITAPPTIGRHIAAKSEGDRLVTHLFESRLSGYQGWQWYAVLTRNSRSKVVTVNELGLLPSEDSILAPEWVPWAERVRPEDAQEPELAEARAGEPAAGSGETVAAEVSADGKGQNTDVQDTDAQNTDVQNTDVQNTDARDAAAAAEPAAQAGDAGDAAPGQFSAGDDATR